MGNDVPEKQVAIIEGEDYGNDLAEDCGMFLQA
jgi:hypothetical protein